MWLNTIAGRTYNDLTQYPVFPWIISDYESATLDLTRRGAYRDLSKPVGALEPSRLKFFIDRYHAFEDPDIPKFIQNGTNVNDVILPPWATSPEDFVMKNLVALESEYVSTNIHHWIDLVFGWKQRGSAAVEANNVFFYLTYEGMVDVDSITDPIVKSSMQSQIAHFGQTPTQVLRDPHPQRQPLASTMLLGSSELSVKSPLFPTVDICCTLLSVPHEAPIVVINMVPGTSMLICMDNNGMFSSHRFGPKSSKSPHHYQTAFLNDISASPTKTSGAFKTKGTTSNVSSGSEQPSEFIELLDRKSRKVIGDKRLLSNQQSVFNSIAILHGGMVLCTAGHHDFSARFHSTTDGTLLYRLLQHQSVVTCVNTSNLGTLLTLGCTDGTISVWKVATINSTLLDSLKIFRGSKASSKPVHANDYSADQVLLGHSGRINCVSASDELGVCISGSASNECLMHNLEDGSILHSFDVPGNLEPGVISLAVSNVGHVVLQSVGTGIPKLYSYHLNGTLLAELSLGDRIMTSLNICARYSKVVVSNSERALVMTVHMLDDQRVLLEKDMYGEISAQGLAPDEMHVVFGVGSGKIVCLPILTPNLALHRTEM
ncbi:hypothetical protein BBJ29_004650 [Phytophthora kernoviae]|uniref:BEACH domain-containing protein n=1 Tax=Phytophthora kernoviae TaxID=325452 RepID=A0A3F2S5P0_9STRA|nr:hypothetical protein BBJ29_004650 [Phytophthora kernoviae]RLN70002.1 hypothetical protein BBP00_00000001 [Phytophthora kernoviae]